MRTDGDGVNGLGVDDMPAGVRRLFRDAVLHLAMDAEDQIAWLEEDRGHPDELALDLDAILDPAAPYLPAAALRPLRDLDALMDAISGAGHAELWTDAALRTAPEWRRARALAREALDALRWPWSTSPPRDATS